MEIETIKKIWFDMGLSCRNSWKPEKAKEFLSKFNLELPEDLIYTQNRYRELSDSSPRVDGEDLLIFVFNKLGLKPNEKKLKQSYAYNGEGSRRDAVEKAYFNM